VTAASAVFALLLIAWGRAGAQDLPADNDASRPLVKTYAYDFEEDLDRDGQPDWWTRSIDSEHPHYVTGKLDFSGGQTGKGFLRIIAGGASAEFLSPSIPIESSSAYDVSGYARAENLPTAGLRASRATIEARLYDKNGEVVGSARGYPEAAGTTGWVRVTITDASRKFPEATSLRVVLALEGLALTGSASFDTIEVRKRPIAFFRMDRPANVFSFSDKKSLTFEAHGLPPGQYPVTLAVRDADGRDAHKVSLSATATPGGVASVSYLLPELAPGPYSIEVDLSSGQSSVLRQSVNMGVLPDYSDQEKARNFGISLSKPLLGDSSEYALTLVSGAGWVKMPLAAARPEEKARCLQLINEIRRVGITPVGILPLGAGAASPSGAAAERGGVLERILKGPEGWLPIYGDTINTFAGSVRWWQLGDEDEPLVDDSQRAAEAVAGIKKFITDVSYQAGLSIASRPEDLGKPLGGAAPDASSVYAAALKGPAGGPSRSPDRQIWLWTDQADWLSGDSASAAGRAAAGMSAYLASGAQVLFLRDPWRQPGVLDGEGNVTPYGVALVNLMHELANQRYSGSITLPNETPNAVFSSQGGTKILLWPAAQPKQERIFLGDAVDVTDVYGRTSTAGLEAGENVILVKDAPVFLQQVDTAVVETRGTFKIEPAVIDSIYEVQPVYVAFTNKFKSAVVGDLTLRFPGGWEAQPNAFSVKLRPGESFRGRSNLVVPYNALAGKQQVTAMLHLGETGGQTITVLLNAELGSSSFKMEIEARATNARLVVYQKVTNASDRPADVSGFIEGEGLERVERLPRHLEPGASTTFSYTLANASSWAGRKLRASVREVKTNRFLNTDFTAPAVTQ